MLRRVSAEGELNASEVRDLFDVPEVIVLSAAIDPRAVAALTEREAAAVAKAIDKRQREFATGRALAKRALARLGWPDVELLNGEDRAPIWPAGASASISHCDTRAVIAAGRRDLVGTVGVDIEHRARLEPRLWKTVFLPEEVAFLEGLPEPSRGRVALVLFSAKEALYKAQYPRTATYMGFHELRVELRLEPGDRRGTLACTFQNDVGPFARGTVAHGRTLLDAWPSGEVVTAVRIP